MRTILTIAAAYWLLGQARSVLQPLAVGLLVWLVLSATSASLTRLLPERFRDTAAVARIFSSVATLLILFVVGVLIGNDVAQLRDNLPLYEANLDAWLDRVGGVFGVDQRINVVSLLERVDFRSLLLTFAGSTAGYLASLFAVLIYLVFILTEAQAIDSKVRALAQTFDEENKLRAYLHTIKRAIDDFLAVQVLVGLMQAVPTFLLLRIVGVDAPVLFATLIFLLSFIPTIGTLFGILIPSAMTLVQFDTLTPFLVVFAILGVIQVACTNIILPKLMSRSLNLSPLVVLFAVFLGGTVWGIVGALIAVPVLTITVIVCAGHPSLRALAVLLSADGSLPKMRTPDARDLPDEVEPAPPPEAARPL